MEYRVYQNMTEFAITVEANNEAEAIAIATATENVSNWERYEPNEDNITYEAVCQEEKVDGVSKEELNLLASSAEDIIHSLMNALEELAPEWYSSADEILKADDWLKWYNGEGTDEELQAICKNLTNNNF